MRRPEVIDPMTRKRIHIHREAGLSHQRIAVLTQTSVRSVQRVLAESEPTTDELAAGRVSRPHGGRPATSIPHADRLQALLDDRPDLPTTEVLRIASTEWGYGGSRATFFRLVRSLRPAPVPEPMVRFEGLPGEFAQFDFGQAVVTYADGRREKVHIFVGRLKFSRQVQVMIVPNEQAETLIRCVVACCHAWGGSPLAWVFDNPTTVRLSKTGEVPVRLHPYLQHLAGELRVAVELCAPRSGNQKGSVERGVGWAKNSFLLVRRFLDRADLEAQLAAWLIEINTVRRSDATKEIPATLLAQEAHRLAERAVPWTADTYPLRESATVTPVATVVVRGTPYQVDPKAIGTVATVLVQRDSIEVITVRGTKAVHPRRDGVRTVQRLPGQASEVLARLHGERKRNYYQRECVLALGPDAASFLENLIHARGNGGWVREVSRLFELLEERGPDRLRRALAACNAQGRHDLFAVEAALKGAA
jgi:transposase